MILLGRRLAALFLLVLFCAALAYVGAQLAVLAGLP
jgi:hypothetical protein